MLYRYFLIDEFGQRLPPEEFAAENDEAARQHARQLMDGKAIELWQGDRMVVMLSDQSR